MKRSLTIHPLLFALFPVLAQYSFNIEQIRASEIFFPAIVTIGGALVLWLLVAFVVRNLERAALLVTPFILLFLSYGSIYSYIGHLMFKTKWYLVIAVFIGVSLTIFVAYFLFCQAVLKSRNSPKIIGLNKIFNVIAACLITLNLLQIGIAATSHSKTVTATNLNCSSIEATSGNRKPDIYYILLDGYASIDQIMAVHHYNNISFAQSLTERGFRIPEKSQSKSIYTGLSIASALNMRYIENVNKNDPRLVNLIRNNEFSHFLKCQGYKYITFGSWWHTTAHNQYADLHYNFFGFGLKNELFSLLLRSSIIDLLFIHRSFHRRSTLAVFDEMPRVIDIAGPKFVFAHIICPHEPFVFGANGEKISFRDSTFSLHKSLYVGQYIFITKKVDKLVDQILAGSKSPPVIVIQSDHGIRGTVGNPYQVFNAGYLPGGGAKLLYNNISPVNTFRIILNYYFNTKYDLLHD